MIYNIQKEEYTNIYSVDLYHLYKSAKEKVYQLDKKYYGQYNLLDIYKYVEDKSKLDIDYGQPLKKITLYDEAGFDYTCEFYQIEWTITSSNRTKRRIIFNNNGDITYSKSKNKSSNLEFQAKYNIKSNDLTLIFNLEKDKICIEFYNNIQYITYNNLSIETNTIDGTKKISYKQDNKETQSISFEIIIDKNSKIINKYIIIKNYNQDKEIDSTYEFYFSEDNLIGALYFSKECKKYNMLENEELKTLAIDILSYINKDNIIFEANIKELENLIGEIKEKIFKLIKSIKTDIPLDGLRKRLDISLSNINTKIKKTEDNEKATKKQASKNNRKTKSLKPSNKSRNKNQNK